MKSKYYCISCKVTGGIKKLLNHAKTSHHVFTNKNPPAFVTKGDL